MCGSASQKGGHLILTVVMMVVLRSAISLPCMTELTWRSPLLASGSPSITKEGCSSRTIVQTLSLRLTTELLTAVHWE